MQVRRLSATCPTYTWTTVVLGPGPRNSDFRCSNLLTAHGPQRPPGLTTELLQVPRAEALCPPDQRPTVPSWLRSVAATETFTGVQGSESPVAELLEPLEGATCYLCCCDRCSSTSCLANQAASPWTPQLTAVPLTASGGRPGQDFGTV